jgi:hypothetical protein
MTFKMQMGEIRRNVNQFDDRANRAIGGIFKYQESRSEVHMKTSAPWTDRTGNARNGLFAKAIREQPTVHVLLLSHVMWYGIFLETIQAGRFAVIWPSVQVAGNEIWGTMRKLFDIMEGG